MISVDFDEVLYNLHDAHNAFLQKEHGVMLERRDITYWDYLKDNFPNIKEVWSTWEKYSQGCLKDGAILFMDILNAKYGVENIQIVTASHPNIIDKKNEFISMFFPKNKVIHSTHEKFHYTKGTFLIDDNADNIMQHEYHNKTRGIVFDHSDEYGWNKHHPSLTRASSYKEVVQLLDEIV